MPTLSQLKKLNIEFVAAFALCAYAFSFILFSFCETDCQTSKRLSLAAILNTLFSRLALPLANKQCLRFTCQSANQKPSESLFTIITSVTYNRRFDWLMRVYCDAIYHRRSVNFLKCFFCNFPRFICFYTTFIKPFKIKTLSESRREYAIGKLLAFWNKQNNVRINTIKRFSRILPTFSAYHIINARDSFSIT